MKRIRVWTTASVTTSLAVGLTLVGNVATGGRLLPWSSPVWLLLILVVLGLVITTARQSRQNDSERIDEFRSEALAAPRGHAPPLTTTFVGRQREAATLRQAIENNGQVTVIGLGGVGKTQLVCEYLRKYRARYRFVWWIRADHQEVLAGDFDAIAIGLNLPAPRESVRTSVMAWLERNNDWLLVFDDVRDGVAVQSFIPSTAGGHIILTSRSRFGLPGCHV